MQKREFLLGIGMVWLMLSFGEGLRLSASAATRSVLQLTWDSMKVGLSDLGGALIVGALGWVGVWIALSYEGHKTELSPKRVTLGVTILAAGLLFVAKMANPTVIAEHLIHAVIILSLAAFAYYAGCRGWLGKW
ncbi:MAG: hypothetical protein ACT4OO_06750 [Nitrospiraceae bacterium]